MRATPPGAPRPNELERQCALTREVQARPPISSGSSLGPDDVIWPDVDAKAEGRGVWITLSEEAVARRQRRRSSPRASRPRSSCPTISRR